MRIVAFIGHNRAGKSTVSNYLCKQLNFRYGEGTAVVMAFAYDLREELMSLYGLPRAMAYCVSKDILIDLGKFDVHPDMEGLWRKFGIIGSEDKLSEQTVTMRDMFINHGTRIRRAQDEDYWVKIFAKRVKLLPEGVSTVILDDTRFSNEFDWVMSQDDHRIYNLFNDSLGASDLANDAYVEWYEGNRDNVKEIPVPIPLDNKKLTTIFSEHLFTL